MSINVQFVGSRSSKLGMEVSSPSASPSGILPVGEESISLGPLLRNPTHDDRPGILAHAQPVLYSGTQFTINQAREHMEKQT
jgi:hypothetical protein